MEYKEKYKNVMEVLKKAASDPKCEDERFCCVVYDLFPELKESEDERIRKRIIHALHGDVLEMDELREALVWLEKQGEQKPIDKIQLGKKYKCIASPRYSTFRRGNIYKPVDNFLCNLMNLCYECFEPIEDSEQKPADKVEPKFHEGEWVTNGDYTWKVVEVKPLDYILQAQDGNIVDDTISHVDEQFHSFTIADAKDGDVLCDYCEEYDNPLIFILKKFERVDFGLVKPSDYSSYCFLTAGNRQIFKEGTYHHKHNIKPATKEQCELLFQKMHEAGYTFDFEKKEPKKLKFKVGDEVITKNEESLTITRIDEEGYWSEDLFICSFDDSDKWELVESAWSEEDMFKVQRICKYLNEAKKYYADITEVRDCIDWLKSLKDRVQPKQEWSERDKVKINRIVACLENLNVADNDILLKDVDWLKSLRPQNTWKPSEEQMNTLNLIISDYYHACTKECDKKAIVLKSILEQLKQL